MRAVPVRVLVHIIRRYRRTPDRTTLKLDVGDADARVDDVDVNALATLWIVSVLLGGAEGESGTMTDARKTLYGDG